MSFPRRLLRKAVPFRGHGGVGKISHALRLHDCKALQSPDGLPDGKRKAVGA